MSMERYNVPGVYLESVTVASELFDRLVGERWRCAQRTLYGRDHLRGQLLALR